MSGYEISHPDIEGLNILGSIHPEHERRRHVRDALSARHLSRVLPYLPSFVSNGHLCSEVETAITGLPLELSRTTCSTCPCAVMTTPYAGTLQLRPLTTPRPVPASPQNERLLKIKSLFSSPKIYFAYLTLNCFIWVLFIGSVALGRHLFTLHPIPGDNSTTHTGSRLSPRSY
ncbi:hypothetical protein DL96DRAFT_347730 [Flagelloscypha sp. PMI_526]|nr:hypothetical protein DL96DRAFT_347730 [Flagelloscypha sp. PMI_526]